MLTPQQEELFTPDTPHTHMALDGVEVSQFQKDTGTMSVLLWSVSGGSLEKKFY
jgi:hypothetical protein